MPVDHAVELGRSAIMLAITVCLPLLAAGLVTAVVVGAIQTMTSVHDHTVSFVPRFIVMLITILLLMPWTLTRLADYSSDLIRNIPSGF